MLIIARVSIVVQVRGSDKGLLAALCLFVRQTVWVESTQLDSYAQHTADAVARLDTSAIDEDVLLTLEQIISDGADVVGHYHLVLARGVASVHAGAASNPDITIKQDAETAQALRDGALHAQGAFLTGRLSVDGDIDKLLEHGPLLAGLLGG